MAQVLAELDALGRRNDTLVVVWSDHGWALGEFSLYCKQVVQCNATQCSSVQCSAVQCNVMYSTVYCVLYCTALHCTTMQCR